jgi:hypothetical protein
MAAPVRTPVYLLLALVAVDVFQLFHMDRIFDRLPSRQAALQTLGA